MQHRAPLGKNRNKTKNKILRAADVRHQTIKSLCQLASDFQCDWCEKKTCKKTALKTFTPKRLKGQGKISLVNFASDKKWQVLVSSWTISTTLLLQRQGGVEARGFRILVFWSGYRPVCEPHYNNYSSRPL